MIVVLHAASGAAAGALTGSRAAALALGPPLHMAGDRVRHRHPAHSAWEYLGGIAVIGLLAKRRGVTDAATIGAVAAVMPDLEHVVPWLRFRGGKIFHRRPGTDRSSSAGLSVLSQTFIATVILVPVLLSPFPGPAADL